MLPLGTLAYAEEKTAHEGLKFITQSVESVCKKPEDAGQYWDVRVQGDGKATVGILAKELGVSGKAEFSKSEWDGLRNTVENSIDYRECAEKITPIFVEKFSSKLEAASDEGAKKPRRSLKGIKWEQFNDGVLITLNGCKINQSDVLCEFTAKSDQDVNFQPGGKSVLYDDIGNKYRSRYGTVANFSREFEYESSVIEAELVRGVSTPVSIRYDMKESNVTSISKLTLVARIYTREKNNIHTFDFRNVKIRLN